MASTYPKSEVFIFRSGGANAGIEEESSLTNFIAGTGQNLGEIFPRSLFKRTRGTRT